MSHDRLCPWRKAEESDTTLNLLADVAVCECDLIVRVREDERERAGIRQSRPSWKYPFTTAVTVRQSTTDDGQSVILASECEKRIAQAKDEVAKRIIKMADMQAAVAAAMASDDMLAKCITAVEEIIPNDSDSGSWEATIAAAWLRHAVSKLRSLEDK